MVTVIDFGHNFGLSRLVVQYLTSKTLKKTLKKYILVLKSQFCFIC